MKSWKFLSKKDIVDVIAPGSATSKIELDQALDFLKSWDLVPRVSDDIFSGHPYVSNTAKFRLQDLKRALAARDSKVIWCLRGGYGAIQLMPQLSKIKPPAHSKLLIGYSDVSTLHLHLSQKFKWISCHGSLLDGLGKNKYSNDEVAELKRILFGQQEEIIFTELIPLNAKARKLKKIKAPIIGGNLMVVASSLGTSHELRTQGKILIFEESGERGYRVDRLFHQLEQSKALKGCKAIVLGDFIGGNENPPSHLNFVQKAIDEFAERIAIPVFSGLKIGHGAQNRPVFFGSPAVLSQTSPESWTLSHPSGGSH